jgi:hypothetical protein
MIRGDQLLGKPVLTASGYWCRIWYGCKRNVEPRGSADLILVPFRQPQRPEGWFLGGRTRKSVLRIGDALVVYG